MFNQLLILIQISLRNLLATPINLIIGGLIFFGTTFFVVGGALLDSLSTSMSRSVIGTVAGHIQVYSSKSKDELALYGTMGGDADLAPVLRFPKIKQALEALPNVQRVVPMGVAGALITSGNTVDVALERLRTLYQVKKGDRGEGPGLALSNEELEQRIQAQKSHVQQIVRVLAADLDKAKQLLDDTAVDPADRAALARGLGDEFWAAFDQDAYGSLEFLENRIAPLVTDSDLLWLQYVGTDFSAFEQSFDQMRIEDGTTVPKGQRGFLIAKFIYEDQMKLKNARRLDKIKRARGEGQTIATDDTLQRLVRENQAQTRDILLQLDSLESATLTTQLQGFLASQEPQLSVLLERFFQTDDANFDARFNFFYATIAPYLDLYKVRIGDTLTIKAFSRAGYVQAVNLKVYGTFSFQGLRDSPLAGAISLMDLMSFRDLYGYLSADKASEIKSIQSAAGAKAVNRETAEDDLFGAGAGDVVADATPGLIDEGKELSGTAQALRQRDLVNRVYSQEEIDDGVILNAAVILKDPKMLRDTMQRINELSDREHLELRAVSWQDAAGLLGKMIYVFQGILLAIVAVVFLVAMVIINNSVMMATLQRTPTIGTLRAIGAQRGFVLAMVLTETLVLGLVFGGAGIAAGSATVGLIARKGIPAPSDVVEFFFSGPRLIPTLSTSHLIVALVLIVVVTVLSTLLPAFLATRVSPLRAMQTED